MSLCGSVRWPSCMSVATIARPNWRWFDSRNSRDTSAYTSSKASPTKKRIPSTCSSASLFIGAIGDCCCCWSSSVGWSGCCWQSDDNFILAAVGLYDAASTTSATSAEHATGVCLGLRRCIQTVPFSRCSSQSLIYLTFPPLFIDRSFHQLGLRQILP